MTIGFLGLGKLGLPCALAVESRGHKVIGYDPSEQVKDIIDTKKLQYQEIWAQEHLDKSKIEIKSVEEVIEEKNKVISMLKNYEVIDSNCNWIHFNNNIDNIDTIDIFNKHKVLTKYCKLPHDNRKNWCRLTIQPNISKEKFIQELL